MIQQPKQDNSFTDPTTGYPKRAIRKQLLSNIKANSCTCGRRERGQEGEKQKHEQKPKRPTSPKKHTAFVPGPKLNI